MPKVRFPKDTKMTQPPHDLPSRMLPAGTVLEVSDEAAAWLREKGVIHADAPAPVASAAETRPERPARRTRRRGE